VLLHYNYHIWFKVCKPIKGRYKLSTNCLLILSGAYLFQQINKKPFTRYSLLKFVTYYNNVRLGKYITVLMKLGFISLAGEYRKHEVFEISQNGISVIRELNDSYNRELVLFCSKYNIEL
jgi:hypothetical protein